MTNVRPSNSPQATALNSITTSRAMHISNSKRGAGCSKPIDLSLSRAGVLREGRIPSEAEFLETAQTSALLLPGHDGLISLYDGKMASKPCAALARKGNTEDLDISHMKATN